MSELCSAATLSSLDYKKRSPLHITGLELLKIVNMSAHFGSSALAHEQHCCIIAGLCFIDIYNLVLIHRQSFIDLFSSI